MELAFWTIFGSSSLPYGRLTEHAHSAWELSPSIFNLWHTIWFLSRLWNLKHVILFIYFIETVLAKQVANVTDLKQCTPNQLKLPKCYHVNLIENKWRMACWNNKVVWMAWCWPTVTESPSSLLSFSLSLSLWNHTFKLCQDESIGSVRDGGWRWRGIEQRKAMNVSEIPYEISKCWFWKPCLRKRSIPAPIAQLSCLQIL